MLNATPATMAGAVRWYQGKAAGKRPTHATTGSIANQGRASAVERASADRDERDGTGQPEHA